MTRIVLSLAALMLLTACGAKNPPDPPGPTDQVTYPKTYPTH